MKTWRFDDSGNAVDATKFNDTFTLMNFDSSNYCVGICYMESEENREAALNRLNNSQFHFDYVCVFRGFIFPVNDVETHSLTMLVNAMEKRNLFGLCWKYF